MPRLTKGEIGSFFASAGFWLERNNSSAHSDCERLSPVRCAQLFHNVLDVRLDGQFTDEELLRNVPVPLTAGNLPENLDLTPSEILVAVMLRQVRRNLWWDSLLTCVHLTDDVQKFLRRRALEQVSARSGSE